MAARKPCRNCGKPKGPSRGSHYCPACRADQCEQSHQERLARYRKPCRNCGGPKPPGRATHLCDACRAGLERKCENCGVNPPRGPIVRLCEKCHAEAQRVEAVRKTEWARNQRQQANAPLLLVGETAGAKLPSIPARPLAAKLDELIARMNTMSAINDPLHRVGACNGTVKEVCANAGIFDRQLTAWRRGEIVMIEFDIVDRVIQRAGWLWWDVYHEESVRTAPLTVLLRDRTPGGRWSKVLKEVTYGDPNFQPDWKMLALIEEAFTGEAPCEVVASPDHDQLVAA